MTRELKESSFLEHIKYLSLLIQPGRLKIADINTNAMWQHKDPTNQTRARSFFESVSYIGTLGTDSPEFLFPDLYTKIQQPKCSQA